MTVTNNRRHKLLPAVLTVMLAAGLAAGPGELGAQIGDRRVPADDAGLSASLRQAAQAVGFLDAGPAKPGSAPDGGSAFLVSDCLLITAGHVVDALRSDQGSASLRLRFPSIKDERGNAKDFAATVVARPRGLWRDPVSDDWVLLSLAVSPGLAPIDPAPANCCEWQTRSVRAAVIGFPADRLDTKAPEAWLDPACTIMRRLLVPVFATNCQATSGNSGGPLLVESDGSWKFAAVVTRAPAPKLRGFTTDPTAYALATEGRITRAIAQAKRRPCAKGQPGGSTKPA